MFRRSRGRGHPPEALTSILSLRERRTRKRLVRAPLAQYEYNESDDSIVGDRMIDQYLPGLIHILQRFVGNEPQHSDV